MLYQEKARVRSQVNTGGDNYLLVLESPEIAKEAWPGQFVNLRTTQGLDPLLRRPISIFLTDPVEGLLYLWYQVVGKGTSLLAKLIPGDLVDLIGPLGKGFGEISGRKAALVGGGMGIAPLIFLGHALAENNQIAAFFGGRSAQHLPPTELLPRMEGFVATEDGSAGYQGFVTDILAHWLETERPEIIYACGPQGMLNQVYKLAEQHNIALQVSLETTMACGVGACLGCTCEKAVAEDGSWFKVCQDGPVFWAKEVKWDV